MEDQMTKIFAALHDKGYVLTDHGLCNEKGKGKYITPESAEILDTSECDNLVFIKLLETIPHLFEPSERMYKKASSYGLKEDYEKFNNQYISNGQFILAMLMAEFESDLKCPNVCFKLTPNYKKSYKGSQQVVSLTLPIEQFKKIFNN